MIRRLFTCSGSGTDPYRNLALERYLTETVPEDACVLYLWQNQNTVVIGRNQNAWKECRTGLLEQEGGVLARRLSGGGAVFHDLGNLNFTFSVTEENYDLHRQQQVILTACRLLGLRAELSGRNDLLAEGRKFSGNSFYAHNGRAFHNGTLLVDADMTKMGRYLSPSTAKITSKGVDSVRSRVVNLRELCPGLTIEKVARCGGVYRRHGCGTVRRAGGRSQRLCVLRRGSVPLLRGRGGAGGDQRRPVPPYLRTKHLKTQEELLCLTIS